MAQDLPRSHRNGHVHIWVLGTHLPRGRRPRHPMIGSASAAACSGAACGFGAGPGMLRPAATTWSGLGSLTGRGQLRAAVLAGDGVAGVGDGLAAGDCAEQLVYVADLGDAREWGVAQSATCIERIG